MELIKVKPGEVQLISTGRTQAMMTGTLYVTYNAKKNFLTLFYEDGTKESATVSNEDFKKAESYFSLVSLVQGKRIENFI